MTAEPVTLYVGDCLDVLKQYPADSIDAVVTDPPYGIEFMGSVWDRGVPPVAIWSEVFRVLKPGGHVLAFAGTRTQHRMAVNIEDAGFDIRDMIAWVYGSGFPKALDVGKAMDKQRAEDLPRVRVVCRAIRAAMDAMGYTSRDLAQFFGPCHPRLIDHWAARDTDSQPALPRPEQWSLLRDMLGIGPELDREVAALNARKGIHGDAWQSREVVGFRVLADTTKARAGFNGSTHSPDYKGETREVPETLPATDLAKQWHGWKSALKPALEPITVAQKPFPGTIAGNVARYGVGAFNVEACRVPLMGAGAAGKRPPSADGVAKVGVHGFGMREVIKINRFDSGAKPFGDGAGEAYTTETSDAGRYPANLIHDGSDEVEAAFAAFGERPGELHNKPRTGGGAIFPESPRGGSRSMSVRDAGTASRFFYCAKANREDRDEGLDALPDRTLHRVNAGGLEDDPRWAPVVRKNHHPTVKPTELMRYLVRLVTPPGGVVLDPFMGSGSTGKAARLEGFRFVGVDLDPSFVEIARARIAWAERQGSLL